MTSEPRSREDRPDSLSRQCEAAGRWRRPSLEDEVGVEELGREVEEVESEELAERR